MRNKYTKYDVNQHEKRWRIHELCMVEQVEFRGKHEVGTILEVECRLQD